MNPILTFDPEFETKCPHLPEKELTRLEEKLLKRADFRLLKNMITEKIGYSQVKSFMSTRYGASGDTAFFEKPSNINGFRVVEQQNNLYYPIFKTVN